MSRSKYKIYNGKSLKCFFENSRIYLISVLFAAGLVTGALLLKYNSDATENISVIFDSYSSIRTEQGIIINFLNTFGVNVIFFICSIFLGFSLIGYPFLMLLPLVKGMGLGALTGFLYSQFALKGFGYCVLMIFPGAAVASLALIAACNDSCEYSRNAYSKAIRGRGQFEKDETRVYLLRQLVFLGVCAISSGIDTLFYEIFSGLFKL